MIPEMSEVERWVLTQTTVRWLCGGGVSAPIAYTAGYWAVGLPELVVVGLALHKSGPILNMYGARQYERGAAWVPGDIDTEMFTMATKFGDVADSWRDEWMTLSYEYHPAGGQVVQVMWPDTRGLFPDEPGYDPRFIDQQVVA